MDMEQQMWGSWAEKLHHWGVTEFVAWLLEAAQPINMIGAQLIYIGQPLFEIFIQPMQIQALAKMLESSEKTKAFVAKLREANTT